MSASGPEQAVVVAEDLRALAGVLEAMRPRERQVLLRRQLDGWSYGRIAEVEGVSVEAVRATLRRARACLRDSLAAEDNDELVGRPKQPRPRVCD